MNRTDALVLPFPDIRATDLPLVGGKGANLGEMAAAGFPVPPGFALTTEAFRRFMAASPDVERVYGLLETVTAENLDTVREVGPRIRQTLLAAPIPQDVADAALAVWRETGADAAYAVRSSATAEDLPDASFAGQQETYLNVRGEAALLDAIRRCWVSLFTDRAILYRIQNGFPHRDVELSVVVQRMVMSEKSGILFTADPVTGHRHTLTIDASFGLGEALVAGLVTPDAYRVDKRTRTILERQIADKQVAILPKQEGGTRQENLPPEQRGQVVLSDAQILALTDLGCRVEAHYGQPQDMEWAVEAETVYLLQTRPITSLYPIDGLASLDDSLHIYFSTGHQQNMTRAMAPLSLSNVPLLAPIGRRPGQLDNPYLRVSGGRLFADISQPLRHPLLRRVLFALIAQFDALAPQAFRAVMERPEFQRPHEIRFSLSSLRGPAGVIFRVAGALWWRDLSGFVPRTNALIDHFLADYSRRLRSQPAGKAQLLEIMNGFPTVFPFILNWVSEAAAGIAATRLLTRLARPWLPPEGLEALTLALPGNVVTEMNLAIGELAELVRASPALTAHFAQLGDDVQVWMSQAATLPDSGPFLDAWERFLAAYGARGPAEIDIMMPRWAEDPLPVLQVIASQLQKDSHGYRAHHQQQIVAREEAFGQLLNAAGRGLLGRLRTGLYRRLYHVVTAVGGMREHHKFMVVRYLWESKQILKKTATQLVATGKLSSQDDIWFLTWQELLSLWDEENMDWGPILDQRRADLERFQKLMPPMIITSDGESPVVQYQVEDAPPGALLGNPVSPGVVEGVVHVIHDPQTETLAPGEILVTVFTDPGWTPLFINAAGLILEVGGALTHGAVVAREYGMPAVVGVRGATGVLRTGQRVRVDGNRGVVEVLV